MSERQIEQLDPSWPKCESVAITRGVAQTINRALLVQPGGNLKVRNWRLRAFVAAAYDVQTEEIQGPDWLDAQFINMDAQMARPLPRRGHIQQFHLMMRRILAEQFGMRFHRETRRVPLYVLVCENDTLIEQARPDDPGPHLGLDSNRIIVRAAPMELFKRFLSQRLRRPLLNETGLTGTYNFSVNWTSASTLTAHRRADQSGGVREPTESELRDALEKVGLRLVDQSGDVDMMVIEHLELPAGISNHLN